MSSAEALDQRLKVVYGPSTWEKVPGKRLVAFRGCVRCHHRDLNGMGRLSKKLIFGLQGWGKGKWKSSPSLSPLLLLNRAWAGPTASVLCAGTAEQGEPPRCRTPVFLRRVVLASATLILEGHPWRGGDGDRQSTPDLLSEKSPDLLGGKAAARLFCRRSNPEVTGTARTLVQKQRRECQAYPQGCFKQGLAGF